jgi:hypothetical protein
MDFQIYLKSIVENIDLASMITFPKSDLRLEALIFKDLGFESKPSKMERNPCERGEES